MSPHNICFHAEKTCCGFLLEVSQQVASRKYPQHMFSGRNKKNVGIFQRKKSPYLK